MSQTIPEQNEDEDDLANTECDLFVNSGVKSLTVALLLVLLTQILLTVSMQNQEKLTTIEMRTAYCGVVLGCIVGMVSYATNIFGLLTRKEKKSSTTEIFEQFMEFVKENEQYEDKWFKVILYHAVFCSLFLSIMFLIELYDKTIDLTLMCTIVAAFAAYSLLSITLSFIKPLSQLNLFSELSKHMITPTEKAFFEFCLSSPSLKTNTLFLLVNGLLYSFNSYFSSNAFTDSISLAVALSWLVVCLIFINKQIRLIVKQRHIEGL